MGRRVLDEEDDEEDEPWRESLPDVLRDADDEATDDWLRDDEHHPLIERVMDLNKRLYDLGTAAGERQNENFGSLLGATGEMLGGLAQALGSSDLEPPSGLIASPDQPMPAPARLPLRGGRCARRGQPLTSEGQLNRAGDLPLPVERR